MRSRTSILFRHFSVGVIFSAIPMSFCSGRFRNIRLFDKMIIFQGALLSNYISCTLLHTNNSFIWFERQDIHLFLVMFYTINTIRSIGKSWLLFMTACQRDGNMYFSFSKNVFSLGAKNWTSACLIASSFLNSFLRRNFLRTEISSASSGDNDVCYNPMSLANACERKKIIWEAIFQKWSALVYMTSWVSEQTPNT